MVLYVQAVEYDFQYYTLPQPADAPVTVLSCGRSLFRDVVDLELPLRPTDSPGCHPVSRNPALRSRLCMWTSLWIQVQADSEGGGVRLKVRVTVRVRCTIKVTVELKVGGSVAPHAFLWAQRTQGRHRSGILIAAQPDALVLRSARCFHVLVVRATCCFC